MVILLLIQLHRSTCSLSYYSLEHSDWGPEVILIRVFNADELHKIMLDFRKSSLYIC